MNTELKKGALIEIDIEDLAFGGRGVARLDNFVWFVERGIPGQRVAARIRRLRKNYGEGVVEQIIKPSPHQIKPPCPYFGTCGGCQLQHLQYEIQVEFKTKQIHDILSRIGGFQQTVIHPTLPADEIYGYRNKMEFTFSERRWKTQADPPEKLKDFALGLHMPGRFDKVLDIDGCLLQSERCNTIFLTTKKMVLETSLKPYNEKTHEGFWRFLVIREGKQTKDLMINFFTTNQDATKGEKALDQIVHQLLDNDLEPMTILHSKTDRRGQAAVCESERLLLGTGKIKERIHDKVFEISPSAFFQTNTMQAQKLFDAIADLADCRRSDIVYDLYSGTGAIGISIADKVEQVLGIEVIESAVVDAKHNAELNNLDNVQFVLADMKNALKKAGDLIKAYGAPDTVILDPPRGGTHPRTIQGLLRLSPPKIVYVSCNPTILARDLKILCEHLYTLKAVQPIDMFPHTGHIEVVALLIRNHESVFVRSF
ncbi:23S rRNA (uracil(1939)-C(5))-methyltransferase RlmD [bacterium]|nr:23S rRNA (uracil(1939)-C(5))-methyltransferase RlmD [bacterium]